MARKVKPPDALPSKAWLMSFGDTMTTLLAFFIVLCSLAEDQTGFNLHTGTGSFVKTLKAGGVSGVFAADKSQRATQFEASHPLYMAANDTELQSVNNGTGPDQDANDIPVKDRERDEFVRFLNEVERTAQVSAEPDTTGETTFDFFERLNNQRPYLPPNYDAMVTRIIPLLRRDSHRIELIVWATTPGQSARTRASLRAGRIVTDLIEQAGLTPSEANHILGIGRPWPYQDMKRPVLSLVIRRIDA